MNKLPSILTTCGICGKPAEFSDYFKEAICDDCANFSYDDIARRVEKFTCDQTIIMILERVSRETKIPIDDIVRKTRKREIVEARQIAHYLAKRETSASLNAIGWEIGRKDHSTVLHSDKTVKNLLATDKLYREKYGEFLLSE